MEARCENCRWFYLDDRDDRDTVYRRRECCFCRRKPFPFSRQYKVGEGSRIDRRSCCENYEPKT